MMFYVILLYMHTIKTLWVYDIKINAHYNSLDGSNSFILGKSIS